MGRRSWITTCVFVLCFAQAALAGPSHTPEDAEALVKRAAAFISSHDRATALAAFDDPKGEFRDGDLYLYVLDATNPDLTMLAHGANPALIGLPQREVVDADGYDFNARSLEILNAHGEGWIEYRWPNPLTKRIARKISFVEKIDGVIIGAGFYP